MFQSLIRLGLVGVFLLSAVLRAEAALIVVNEGSDTGGGTLVNDGSGDVSSSNGSSSGFTLLMSQLGLTDLNLESDLAQLGIQGQITDGPIPQNTFTFPPLSALSADLTVLRVIGTVDLATTPCNQCATLNQVRVGGTLSPPSAGDIQNVLFAFDIVGSLSGLPWELAPASDATPAGLSSPQNLALGQFYTYFLSQTQINFIMDRMAGYNVDQVSLGLGVSARGVLGGDVDQDGDIDFEPVRSEFQIQPIPEPATLLLLGGGLAAAGLRRVRRAHHH